MTALDSLAAKVPEVAAYLRYFRTVPWPPDACSKGPLADAALTAVAEYVARLEQQYNEVSVLAVNANEQRLNALRMAEQAEAEVAECRTLLADSAATIDRLNWMLDEELSGDPVRRADQLADLARRYEERDR